MDFNGCLGIWEQTTDFLIEWFEDSLPTLYQQDDIIYEYNQYAQSWSKKSCTVFSAMWAISDLFNYEVPIKEAKKVDDITYTLWRMPDSWWWVQSAVKTRADYWNDNHSDLWKVAYYKIDITNDDLVNKILDKWYTIMTSFSGNGKYSIDFLKDWILDWTEFWASTYWHAVNIIKRNWKICVKDSDKWRKTGNWKKDCNIYELAHPIREIKPFSTRWYIYTKVAEDALEEIKRLNTLKSECNNAIIDLWKIRHLVNEENFKWILHYTADKLRVKIKNCDEQLAKYE
jgi:hypothetical protein